ncbi:hypothetical protein ACFQUX_20780 [Pantoea stewartii]
MATYKKANKKWLLVDMLLMISIFCLVILSGTRIAFLAYFFITLYQINRHYGLMNILKPMRNRLIALVVISVIAFLSGNRWVEAFNNIKEYDKNSSTSVGARVAIWDSGLHFFLSILVLLLPMYVQSQQENILPSTTQEMLRLIKMYRVICTMNFWMSQHCKESLV